MKRRRTKKKMAPSTKKPNVAEGSEKRNNSKQKKQSQQGQSSNSSAIVIDDNSSAIVIDDSSSDYDVILEDKSTCEVAAPFDNPNVNIISSRSFVEPENDVGSIDLEVIQEIAHPVEPSTNVQKRRERRCFPNIEEKDCDNNSFTEESGPLFEKCQIYTSQIHKYREDKTKLVASLQHLADVLSDEEPEPSKKVVAPTIIVPTCPPTIAECTGNSLAKHKKPKKPKAQKKLYSNLEKLLSHYQEGQNRLDTSLSEDGLLLGATSPSKLQNTYLVTVKWKTKLIPCHLEANEAFSSLLPKISSVIGVPAENIMFFLNEKLLDPLQTPQDVNFIRGTFIECLVSSGKKSDSVPAAPDADTIEIKIQSNTERKKLLMKCNKIQPLQKVLEEYAALKNLSPEQIKLCFDGEAVELSDSPEDVGIEDGDCLDVFVSQ